jgi:AcrR family transcriptional regulator
VDVSTDEAGVPIDGRRLRWERHKRERRELIIGAAIELIEEHPPGTDIHVHQIAERAGLARPAVYRHFTDRADLDQAVQQRVLELLRAELDPPVVLVGSIEQVILRIVETYVGWADAHPSLHRVGVREGVGRPGSPLRNAVQFVADIVGPVIIAGAETFGAALDEDDIASIDLLVFGLVSEVVGAVRLWLGREERRPSASALARRLADAVWFQLDGLARKRGAAIDPTLSIEEIVARALGAEAP